MCCTPQLHSGANPSEDCLYVQAEQKHELASIRQPERTCLSGTFPPLEELNRALLSAIHICLQLMGVFEDWTGVERGRKRREPAAARPACACFVLLALSHFDLVACGVSSAQDDCRGQRQREGSPLHHRPLGVGDVCVGRRTGRFGVWEERREKREAAPPPPPPPPPPRTPQPRQSSLNLQR